MNFNRISRTEIKSIIESILFAYAEPITAQEIRDVIDIEIPVKEIEVIMNDICEEYMRYDRGIQVFKLNNRYQMGTNKKNCSYVKEILNPQKKKTLTQAAIETLTIIAYKQPVTKVEVEHIRGVKSDGVVATLVELNLIQEAGRLDKIGKPILYKTTDELLKLFEINSLKDLPKIEDFNDEEFNNKAELLNPDSESDKQIQIEI